MAIRISSRVLLVEDNIDDETLTRKALNDHAKGIDLQIARDGRAALDLLARPHWVPDVVLLDIKLPLVSGFEVLEEVRSGKGYSLFPIVVFTSSNDPRDMERCYKAGASSFVVKPIDSDLYIASVNKIAEYWLNVNSHPGNSF